MIFHLQPLQGTSEFTEFVIPDRFIRFRLPVLQPVFVDRTALKQYVV